MTLRGLYGYMTALTRPIRYTEETGGGKWLRRRTETLPTLCQYVGALTRPASPTCVGEGNR